MKGLGLFTSLMAALILSVSCGYKTAPTPYSSIEERLPIVAISKPLFKGDVLVVNWTVNPAIVDATADVFRLNVFKVQQQCRYCKETVLDTLEMQAETGLFAKPPGEKDAKQALALYQYQSQYRLEIGPSVYHRWEKQGFYEFSVQYKTETGELAQASKRVAPVRSDKIPIPEWTMPHQEKIEATGEISIILRWHQVPEYVYQSINTDAIGNEKVQYYGLNLYLLREIEETLLLVKWNKQPLRGDKIELQLGNAALYACFVDRYNNESEKSLVLDNRFKEIEEEKPTEYHEK